MSLFGLLPNFIISLVVDIILVVGIVYAVIKIVKKRREESERIKAEVYADKSNQMCNDEITDNKKH